MEGHFPIANRSPAASQTDVGKLVNLVSCRAQDPAECDSLTICRVLGRARVCFAILIPDLADH